MHNNTNESLNRYVSGINGNVLHFQCLKSKAMYPMGERFHSNYIIMIIFDALLAPCAIILNLLVLIVLAKHRSLRTVPNCILISLAASDMIAGLLIQPMKAVITAMLLRRRINCYLYLTALQLGYLIGMTSYLSLTLMSIERYVAIFHPFKYHKWTTSKTVVVKPIVAIWLFSAVIMGLSFLTPQMSVMRLFVIALIPTSLVWSAFVYIKATILVRKLNNQVVSCTDIQTASNSFALQEKIVTRPSQNEAKKDVGDIKSRQIPSCDEMGLRVYAATDSPDLAKKDKHHKQKLRRPNSKATRLVIIIMITLCLCYIPSGIMTFLREYSNSHQLWIYGVHDWGTSFVLLNSTLNPIIYCLKITEMRIRIKNMLCSLWHQLFKKLK